MVLIGLDLLSQQQRVPVLLQVLLLLRPPQRHLLRQQPQRVRVVVHLPQLPRLQRVVQRVLLPRVRVVAQQQQVQVVRQRQQQVPVRVPVRVRQQQHKLWQIHIYQY